MSEERPEFPIDDLRAAVSGDPAARDRIDALDRELNAREPSRTSIDSHVGELRKHPSLGALITAWFEDPRTQAFIDELTGTGL